MEKNYYDILQINKNAAPEIVEKAYKTLVRMYHPDLQESANKQEYEEKLKLINEAYETLSNEQKRKQYDLELEQIEQMKRQQENVENSYSNFNNSSNSNDLNNQYQNPNNYNNNYDINEKIKQARIQNEKQRIYEEEEYNRKVNDAINKAYHDAYIQDLKNRGYTIEYKKSFKDYIKNFIAFIITLFILLFLIQIPFIKNFLIDIYNENEIIHLLIDTIVDFFYNLLK